MDDNAVKTALIETIEKLIESDPNAVVGSYAMLQFLEIEDLIAIEQSLYKSKANRSKENDVWFDELCKKD